MTTPYARVALPTPLRRQFDYLIPDGLILEPGHRVEVPFGNRKLVGIVTALITTTETPASKLKAIESNLDQAHPPLAVNWLDFLTRVARYYHHSLGDTLFTALPSRYRKPVSLDLPKIRMLCLNTEPDFDPASLKRAPRQRELIEHLQQQPGQCISEDTLRQMLPTHQSSLNALIKKNLLLRKALDPEKLTYTVRSPGSTLNSEQQAAFDTIRPGLNSYHCYLLYGVTGSGKTEVYLHTAAEILSQGKQVLLLVPEITLTPQFIQRFNRCFQDLLVTYHSGLADKQRAQNWLRFKSGVARMMIGTRSAIFTPMADPGIIIIDEEHDASYKQQDGLKYSARDMAVMRGKLEDIPIILGSATPCFETLHNAQQGRYEFLKLTQRAGRAVAPEIRLVNMKLHQAEEGFTPPVLDAMEQHLARGEQILVYLNRRGFSPVLICSQCGWQAVCHRCDRPTTFHARKRQLNCHHCGNENPVPHQCPGCGNLNLAPVGFGTERIEKFLQQTFPTYAVSRFDRDQISRKGELEASLEKVHSNEARILLGTQMLTKGHDFPNVTLVVILNADQGLFGADLRAAERFIQTVTQVSGRAGRAEKPGTVYIQTQHLDHPLIQLMLERDYLKQAAKLLQERKACHMPPYAYSACIRAEAHQEADCFTFLHQTAELLYSARSKVEILGPALAVMPRKAGRYRVQLLLLADQRADLHNLLNTTLPQIESLPAARKTRWALEIDPADMA